MRRSWLALALTLGCGTDVFVLGDSTTGAPNEDAPGSSAGNDALPPPCMTACGAATEASGDGPATGQGGGGSGDAGCNPADPMCCPHGQGVGCCDDPTNPLCCSSGMAPCCEDHPMVPLCAAGETGCDPMDPACGSTTGSSCDPMLDPTCMTDGGCGPMDPTCGMGTGCDPMDPMCVAGSGTM